MIVMKFGGTSVKDSEAVDRVSVIIKEHLEKKPMVVVSATGDTTDRLVEILDLIDGNKPGAKEIVERIAVKHRVLIDEVVTDTQERDIATRKVEKELARLKELVFAMIQLGDVSVRSRDAVLALGERMSAPILAASLSSRGVKAESVDPALVMTTDSQYGAATPDFEKIRENCKLQLLPISERGVVPVIGGFVGADNRGVTTTLGRGGSDLTASIIAKAVGASELNFWKDVDGILTADPRIVKQARPLQQITFEEAAELTFLGSGVLHPASIAPAVEAGIPVLVRNSYKKESPGTRILKEKPAAGTYQATRAAASITYKKNQALIHIYSTRMLGASGFLRRVFEVFDRLDISVDHIATSEVSVTVSVDNADVSERLAEALTEVATMTVTRDVCVVSVVGEALRTTPGVAATVFDAVKDINVLFITHGGGTTNLTMGFHNRYLNEAVQALHRGLFEQSSGLV